MFPSEQGGDPFQALTNSLKQSPRLGWLYPGEEAAKLRSDPAAFANLLERALAGLPDSAQWRNRSPPYAPNGQKRLAIRAIIC
jgi:hypothetical protein